MDALFVWVKNIVAFLLIVTLVFELLPTKDYGKYVRVSAGMILLVVIVGPLAKFMGLEGNLDFYLSWENLKSQMNVDLNEDDFLDTAALEQKKTDAIIEEYKKNLEEQIRRILRTGNFKAGNIVLRVEEDPSKDTFGQILSMEIFMLEKSTVDVGQVQDSGIVEQVEIPSVEIEESVGEIHTVDAEVRIQLKKQLAENFCMDMNQIFIDGG